MLVINTTKLSFDSSGFIEQLVVLINKNISPVAHFNCLFHLMEDGHRLVRFVMKHNLFISKGLNILKRSVLNQTSLLIYCGISSVESKDSSRI